MENKVFVSSSPHIRSSETINSVMRDVVIALLPATAAGIWYFGVSAAVVTVLAILSAMATEVGMLKLRNQKATINDYSAAVVTGLLLAMNLPSTAPWWLVIMGSAFAIAIVKHAFGGLGHNFMNPALAARAMLLAAYPVEMTGWVTPGADAVSTATPLAIIKDGLAVGSDALYEMPSLMDVFLGNVGGCLGETSALALILGGLYLLYRGVITIRIPAAYIGTVAVLTLAFNGFDSMLMIYHLFAGGLMLGAFFMATDYASSPITAKGQIIFGIGCGLITTIIRFFGGYPEGVSYSILLMNVAAPLIEKYTSPRVFGGAKK